MSLSLGLGLGLTRNKGVGVLNAASPLKAKLQTGSGDVNLVAAGDSLTDSTNEVLYLGFADLATRHPALTFEYYPPDGAGGYGAVVTVSTGTGSRKCRLYNNSVAGRSPDYLMGSRFTGAFVTPGYAWDAVFWSYGKNIATLVPAIIQGMCLAAIAQVQLAFPAAQHIVINQYPNRDDSNMAKLNTSWRDIVASAPGISMLDLYSGPYDYSDYLDNSHMTPAANSDKLLPKWQAWWNGARAGSWTPETPWLSVPVANMLDGAGGEKYANFALDGTSGSVPGAAAAVPFGWTNSGTISYSKEATITYDGAARAQKMLGSGAAQAFMRRNADASKAALLAGNYATLTVIQYMDAGADVSVGQIGFLTNGTGALDVTSRASSEAQGYYKVSVLGPFLIPADATTDRVYLYNDVDSTPDPTHAVYYQWACLALGKLPRSPA